MLLQKFQRMLMMLTIAAAGVIIGANCGTNNVAHGEMRPAPEQPAFQRGDQISVPILRDIAATLHQMDARLGRLETMGQRMQSQAVRHAVIPAEPDSQPQTEETTEEVTNTQ